MLYVILAVRSDWPSTLPKENHSFFYPGVTGSFIFTELLDEDMEDILSLDKVRMAWGKTSDDANVYTTRPVYGQSSNRMPSGSLNFPLGGVSAFSAGNILGSDSLSPKMTTEFEVGLDMVFFHNHISFGVTHYNRNSDKQIFSLSMGPSSGYMAQNMNLGEVRNHGVELLVSATSIQTRDFSWMVSWNFTKNWSGMIGLPEELGGQIVIYGLGGGTSMYTITGEPIGVFKAEAPRHDLEGYIVANAASGLPVAAEKLVIYGNINYDYQMGVSTTLKRKGVSLSADSNTRQSSVMYSRTKDISYFTGNATQTAYNDCNTMVVPNSVNEIINANGTISYVESTTPISGASMQAGNPGTSRGNSGSDMGSCSLIDKSYIELHSIVLS